MKFRTATSSVARSNTSPSAPKRFSLRIAVWLLDNPHLGAKPSIKQVAGHLLKQPARKGVVLAQSRLGQLMCRDCGSSRDQRIGQELLRQAARAGDRVAQQELSKIED
ncbi:sel1 repeat family protein [Pseudomonas sp. SIMBA_077]